MVLAGPERLKEGLVACINNVTHTMGNSQIKRWGGGGGLQLEGLGQDCQYSCYSR